MVAFNGRWVYNGLLTLFFNSFCFSCFAFAFAFGRYKDVEVYVKSVQAVILTFPGLPLLNDGCSAVVLLMTRCSGLAQSLRDIRIAHRAAFGKDSQAKPASVDSAFYKAGRHTEVILYQILLSGGG